MEKMTKINFSKKRRKKMKTIRELENEGLISSRLRNALIRGIGCDNKFRVKRQNCYRWERNDPANGWELTVKDIFDLWTESEMLRWRGFGLACLNELKGLI
jgi:hypothetical protein